ncbi:MAG: type 2 lantipeptide synthetase LanM family protein [Cyanosarcina radialis HA8281-LM2]|jgi:type 2 lantibiotic biosynthesis protein LanM|nr:type 2 lantipeptide synthetase LanM family protein [Cyanosarcina radialis HA8281-LM2]
MDATSFQKVDWYQAIELAERIVLLKNPKFSSKINLKLAQSYIDRWKAQAPFDQDSYFNQRLATENITEKELLNILGESIETVRDRLPKPPTWLTELARAFSRTPAVEPMTFPEALKEIQTIGFLEIIEPLISQGRDRLFQGIQNLIQAHPNLPFDPNSIEDLLFINLPKRLLTMLSRTLVLELNVARLQGLLSGDTPQERFQSFIERLRQRDVALSILQEYPVLARQLTICIDRWVAVSLEFLEHLCSDWEVIQAQFGERPNPPAPLPYEGSAREPRRDLHPLFKGGRGDREGLGAALSLPKGVRSNDVLTEANFGAGDSHREGRSVVIAKFSSGFQIVYKPRSLSLDVHFQELLEWINQRGEHPPFRTLKICDRGTYGWMEFIEPQPCTSEAEIERFYQRQGGYLAILYALEAVDFHNENLIAAGEHPMLLDLEALFHPRVGGGDLKPAGQIAHKALGYSVYGIGLLPHRTWSTDESAGVDISGLGTAEGQLTPQQIPRWQGVGTDEMKLTRQRVEMLGAANQPTLNGEKVQVVNYAEAIASGFTNLYRLLLQHRDELLAENGPLARFAEDTVRVIVRATRTYAMLLSESFHPDMLRHALDRDRLLDRLWLGVEHQPHLAKLIPAERADLLEGDIPMFTTCPASEHIWTSSGQQIADLLDRPGLESVRGRVQQLNEADLERQLWIIRASFTSLDLSADEPKRRSNYQLTAPTTIADRDRLLSAARAVGDRLESLALLGDGEVSWIGLALVNQRHWSIAPLGCDLYDGLPGVILFLAYLGEIVKEESYTFLARAAFKTFQAQLEQSKSWLSQVGGFSGWGGIIYTLIHLGTLWQQPELIAQAESFVELLPPLIDRDPQFDIIGGTAGCLSALLNLYRLRPNPKTLEVAIQCGDRLLTHAQVMETGCGWVIPGVGAKPLAGFSHGNAGIAWALLSLAAVSGEERFRQVALEAIAYERSIFSVAASNWPDLREFEATVRSGNQPAVSFTNAWCHGAPGIGLARLQCLQYLESDPEIRSEIDTAIATTVDRGFGHNHSLCHGDLGNLELLLQASEMFDREEYRSSGVCAERRLRQQKFRSLPYSSNFQWRSEIDRFAAVILDSIDRDGWLCGIPLEVESPGLMTGLAGIGFGLLRLAEPKRVPSVLVLAPPPHNSLPLPRLG